MVVWEITWKRFWNGFLFPPHVDEVGYPEHIKKQLLPLRKFESHYYFIRYFKRKYMYSFAKKEKKRNCESNILNKLIWCIVWVRTVFSNFLRLHFIHKKLQPTVKGYCCLSHDCQPEDLIGWVFWTHVRSSWRVGQGMPDGDGWFKGWPDMGTDLVKNSIKGTWK